MSQLSDRFVHAVLSGARARLGVTTDDLTTPAAAAEWAQWPTPEQWADAQTRIEETNA